MPSLTIMIIGEIDRPDFSGIRPSLEPSGRTSCFPAIRPALTALEAGEIVPDVIILVQPIPGQFSRRDVDRLRQHAPLSRIIALLGSWSEGEMRSGRPLPGVVRVYWHQWQARAERELRQLVQGRSSSWGLPVTATDEERMLGCAAPELPPRRGLLALCAKNSAAEDWLFDACRALGYSAVRHIGPDHARYEGAVAAVFDAAVLDGGEIDRLQSFIACFPGTLVVVSADFPRIEDHLRALEAGAAAVLAKPLNLDDLSWQLNQLGVF